MPKNNQLVLLTPAFPESFGTQLFCLAVSFLFYYLYFLFLIYWFTEGAAWSAGNLSLRTWAEFWKVLGQPCLTQFSLCPVLGPSASSSPCPSHPSSQGCAHRAWLQGFFPFSHTEAGTVLNLWWYVPPACMRGFRENIITHFIKSLFMFCSVSIFHSHICLLSDRADNIK